jgi:hypothetical protein
MSQQQQWQESVGGFNLSDLEKMLPAGARLVGTQQLPAGARLVGTQQTVFAMGSTVTESVVPPQRLFTSAHTMPTMSPQVFLGWCRGENQQLCFDCFESFVQQVTKIIY